MTISTVTELQNALDDVEMPIEPVKAITASGTVKEIKEVKFNPMVGAVTIVLK